MRTLPTSTIFLAGALVWIAGVTFALFALAP